MPIVVALFRPPRLAPVAQREHPVLCRGDGGSTPPGRTTTQRPVKGLPYRSFGGSPGPTREPMISYFQAIVIGLLQGVTELFPISSLGHSVLVPGLARLGQPGQGPVRRRVVLPRLPRRPARRHRHRPARLLPGRLGPHHRRLPPHAADPAHRDARRAPGLAARRRDDPRRDHRPRLRALRCAPCSPSRSPPRSSSRSTA